MRPLLATLVAAAITACALPVITPPSGFPCGFHGTSCGNHYCCDETEICGTANQGVNGNPYSGCPEGYCCFAGNQLYSLSVSLPKHQYSESR